MAKLSARRVVVIAVIALAGGSVAGVAEATSGRRRQPGVVAGYQRPGGHRRGGADQPH